MRKLILPLIALFFLAACSDDIRFNNPSMQGRVDTSDYFHTFDVSAEQNSNGSVVITGKQGSRVLKLNLGSLVSGSVYSLGGESQYHQASYKTVNGILYRTNFGGEGVVYISSVEGNAVSGSFSFTALNDSEPDDVLHISQGAFYEILIENGGGSGEPPVNGNQPENCDEAVEASGMASLAYTQAVQSGSAEEIMTACVNYRTALELQIELCGDQNGFIQQQIDGLDCGDSEDDGEDQDQ